MFGTRLAKIAESTLKLFLLGNLFLWVTIGQRRKKTGQRIEK
jgi:hypothetical protein